MKKLIASIVLATVVLGLMYINESNSVASETSEIVVYQSRTCGCCKKWVKHLENAGLKVRSVLLDDVGPIKRELNIPNNLSSCHTAKVGKYVVEGHVPASAIKKLLAEKPAVKGLSVPGMPMGSPGMEGSYSEPYDVLTFDGHGNNKVFMSL
ncbi:DUF411 domain-containing protein [Peredibacter sp. HCB2-198]|uniref:DUF411 domain-containing protein n=1 Tax=Peredibacter sp. HCB2-198 TaxID=3383025 RepID=UPI0038B605D6